MSGNDEFEVEDMGAPVGIETDDEPDKDSDAGNKRLADSRFDPATLYSEIKAKDWRVTANTNAEGVSHPAVEQGGVIRFFEGVPGAGHSNWHGDQGGGKTPWPFRAVKMSIELLCPPAPVGFWVEAAEESGVTAHEEIVTPQAMMLGTIIGRGFFSMTVGDVPVLTRIPVSQIGGAGGLHHEGIGFGSVSNMRQDWSNAFKLPNELILSPQANTAVKAWIDLNVADLKMLGTGGPVVEAPPGPPRDSSTPGWGQPFAPGLKMEYNTKVKDGFSALVVDLPYFGVRLNMWGQRGLNIRAGRSSLTKSTAARR